MSYTSTLIQRTTNSTGKISYMSNFFPALRTLTVEEETKRQDVNKRVSHLSSHECGGVSYSSALHDTGILLPQITVSIITFPLDIKLDMSNSNKAPRLTHYTT